MLSLIRTKLSLAGCPACFLAVLTCLSPAILAQPREIDIAHSTMTVHVSKSGVFSAFGHDHEISAPIASGAVDPSARRVEVHVHAAALRVRDPDTPDKDREQIQKNMVGPEVLDTGRYPEISFRSTSAEKNASGGWRVQGELTIHGQTRPVTLDVSEKEGRFAGSARLRQSDFGIKPIKIAGGTVRVKDELRVDFDIQLAHSTGN